MWGRGWQGRRGGGGVEIAQNNRTDLNNKGLELVLGFWQGQEPLEG